MSTWSMSARLTRHLAGGLAGLWLLAVATAGIVVRSEMNEVFDSVLEETAQHLLSDILDRQRDRLERLQPGDPPIMPEAVPHDEYVTYQLFSADGRLLLRSHGAAAAAPAAVPSPGFEDVDGARVYVEPSADGRFLFRIAEPPDHRGHAIRGALTRLLLPLLGLLAATVLLVPVAVRRMLAPVQLLHDEIERRGGENLAPIPPLGLPVELQPIKADVNRLLHRLRLAMAAERNFAANAAHELRTPVAAAMAQAQLLASRTEDGQAAALVRELRGLGQRVEKILQLGRAESGLSLRQEPTDLLLPLQLLVDEFNGQGEYRGRVILRDDGMERVLVRGDLDTLAIALRNLLENALVHGDPSAPVDVRISADGTVTVRNAGPALTPDELAASTDRFVSYGATGSGIGLAIVQAIAEQAGGRLSLRSPAPGRTDGFEATLSLPSLDGAGQQPFARVA